MASGLPSGYYQAGRPGVAQEFLAQPPQQPGNQLTVGNVGFPKAATTPGATTISKDEALKKFFGQPRPGFFDTTSTYDEYDVENFDLPDAYRGPNKFLRQILIDSIKEADEFPIRTMAPLQRSENNIEIQWDTWEFNSGLLGRTPEESVSRLLTSSFNSHRDFMVRFGLGLYLEHGFYKTPMGETAYLMQLKQISNATIDTMTYGALFYILNCHPFRDSHSGHRLEQNASINSLDRSFQEEIENWAIVQKSEDGLILMYNKMQEEFRNRNNGQEGDIVLVPNGTKMYAAGRPENRYFYFTGKTKGQQDPLPGVALTESRPFRQGADQPADDPAFRERVIGGFFHMLNGHLQHVPAEEYQTSMMDTYIYSETCDDYVRISFKEAVKYLGLYDWPSEDQEPSGPTRYSVGVGDEGEVDSYFSTRPTIAERGRKLPATSHGIRFWGSLTSWGKAYENTGLLQRAIQRILSLDAETVNDFLKRYGGASGVRPPAGGGGGPYHTHGGDGGGGGGAVKERTTPGGGDDASALEERLAEAESEATGTDFGDFTVDPDFAGTGSSMMQQPQGTTAHDAQKGEAYFTPVRARNAASEQYNRLGQRISELPTEYKSISTLLKQYQSAGRSITRDDGHAFVELVYKLREVFYSADRDASVLELSQDYGAEQDDSRLTGVESKLLSTTRGTPIKEADLRAANNLAWLPRGEGHINEKALLVVSVHGHHSVPVRQPSDALTFTTKHAVLFELTNDQYKSFLTNKGVIGYLSRDVDDSLYAERLALLQYSVAISALYKRIAAVAEKGAVARANIQKIIPELKSLVSQQHPLGESYSLAEDLMSAVSNKQLPSLTLQYLVDEVIQSLQSLAIHIFSGADDDSEVIGEVQKVIGAYTSAKHCSPTQHTIARDIHRALAAEADIPDVSILGLIPRASPADGALVKQWSEEAKKLLPDIVAKGAGAQFPTKDEWEAITPAILAAYVVLKKDKPSMTTGGFGSFILLQAAVAKKVQVATKGHNVLDAFYAGVKSNIPSATEADLKGADITVPAAADVNAQAAKDHDAWKKIDEHNKDMAQTLADHLSHNIDEIKGQRVKSGLGLGKRPTGHDAISSPVDVGATGQKAPASKVIEGILRNLPTADGDYLYWALENNVPVPLGILGWRPHKRYLAGTSLVMKGGGEAAFTWWAKADFQLGDNVAQKMLFGHFTMYAKTIVHNTRKVVHHYNSFVKEYLGGNGHAFWNPLDLNDKSDYESGELNKDIFFTATRADFRVTQNHLSLTGVYPQQLSASADAQAATRWGGSAVYNDLWGWRVGGAYNPITEHHSRNAGAKFNVVCFQEHQRLYNHKGNKTGEFDLYVIDKGHWGPRVYPGCGAVRRGKQKYLAAPAYLSEKTTTLTP